MIKPVSITFDYHLEMEGLFVSLIKAEREMTEQVVTMAVKNSVPDEFLTDDIAYWDLLNQLLAFLLDEEELETIEMERLNNVSNEFISLVTRDTLKNLNLKSSQRDNVVSLFKVPVVDAHPKGDTQE